jgi:hypothetical protein
MMRLRAPIAVTLSTLALPMLALPMLALPMLALATLAPPTLALAAATTAAPALAAPVSGPARTPTSAQAASGWLARQMVGGSHYVTVFDGVTYPDQGGTIDAIFAFAAASTANDYGARAIAWLERPSILSNYIGNGTTSSYAGATAKTALAAEVRGVNPAAFGGVNLIKRLAALLRPSGRYSDHSSFGDYSDAFSQSLAIMALSRHVGAPGKAVNFLYASECKNGGFPLYFAQKTCVSDTDSTAMDVQALLAAGWKGAAARGLAWLAHEQLRNGGLDATGGTRPNANTTGLAGAAFAAGRWLHHATLARDFLISLQVGCSGPSSERGAIDYDSTGFAVSTAVDATAQGILGLADISLAAVSSRGSQAGDPHLAC